MADALTLASRMRRGEVEDSPYALWKAAQTDGTGDAGYRHAMLHAGALGEHVTDGTPCAGAMAEADVIHRRCETPGHSFRAYAICPECGENLNREERRDG